MQFLDSLRLRAIKCFFFFIAFYFAIGINPSIHCLNSKIAIFEGEYSILSTIDSNGESLLAEIEEGEEDVFYNDIASLAYFIYLPFQISNFYPIVFLFRSFRIQAHLLNLPPPIS